MTGENDRELTDEQFEDQLVKEFKEASHDGDPPPDPGPDEPNEFEIGGPVTPEDKKTHAQKKADRLPLMEELDRTRRENEQLRQQLASAAGVVEQMRAAPPPPPPDQKDEIQEKLDAVAAEQSAIIQGSRNAQQAGTLTKEQWESDAKKLRELTARSTELQVEKTLRDRGQGQGQALTKADIIAAVQESKYPSVYANPKAKMWAKGRFDQLIADGAAPAEASDQALSEAQARYRLGGSPRPRDVDSRRLVSSGKGDTGSGKPARKTMKFDKVTKAMALARYEHMADLSDAQKLQLFANEYGDE